MKILGIVAGPRKKGNTATLVEETLEGAKDAGHETILYYLSDLEIKPLEAGKDGYVYPEDGFKKLMPHIESMDALVDRLYYYGKSHGEEYREKFPDGVKFISVITCGWDNSDAYDEVVNWLEDRMKHYWNMSIHGALRAYGTGKHPVVDNNALLDKARELGKSL